MELIFYLTIAMLSVVFSIRHAFILNPCIFFYFWFVIYLLLSILVRQHFDVDINTYAASMHHTEFLFYYLREPVVWFGQRWLFIIIQNELIVFVIFDIVIGLFLYRAFKNFKLPQYAFFSFLIFFPFVLGMQNIYRQWVASILFIYSFSLFFCCSSGLKKYIIFIMSILAHNVTAIFIPLLYAFNNSAIRNIFYFILLIISFVALYLGVDSKSAAETGSNLEVAYLLLLPSLVIFIFILDGLMLKKPRLLYYKIYITLFSLSFFSTFFLSSTGVERLSMFGLMIAYPLLVILIDRMFVQKLFARALFSILGFVPLFFFETSQFIL